ncbi:MAG TPA: Glu/Leu/Phe/Val dehydrogenase dimerization domain-containing protein [Actinomycetota bacterium]|nr:Glu/Leu/Phe/Val dehydrogenase dimerization domain-containing protein [Actinomycetota bacterium]
MFDDLVRTWDGELVVVSHDPESGAWFFVCIHSTALGPAGGGTRLKTYPTPTEGLADGLRLSAGMTRKFAVADLPYGGGKAVISLPEMPAPSERRRLILRHADLVDSLGGTFLTAPDVNTSEADMDVMAERTPHVLCRTPANGGSGDPSPSTARGVFHGIRSSLDHVYGSPDTTGRTVLVQGVGAVGKRLVFDLLDTGARVLVSDVDGGRARKLAEQTGVCAIDPRAASEIECDVFAPCALGGVLNERSIPRLRCAVVAGSANNQLASPEDAERLTEAGILYAPDYVINAGGALHGIGLEVFKWTQETLERRLQGIGKTLTQLFMTADAEEITTEESAARMAAERLAESRPAEGPARGPALTHR